MLPFEWTFVVQFAIGIVLLVLMLILLHRINCIKIQMDMTVREVRKYVDYITQEDETSQEVSINHEVHKKSARNLTRKEREEEQNHLIQSVLKEYFP